jgi:hypothetical protein
VVVHEKEGREHCHIVWSRIDLDKMRTISDSHNYRTHEIVARDLEREFGHARVRRPKGVSLSGASRRFDGCAASNIGNVRIMSGFSSD